MALQMTQLGALFPGSRLGQADIVAAVLGPLAVGGADVYRTYTEGEQSKEELEQRQREFEQLSQLYREQQKMQQKQHALATAAALRQEQVRSSYQAGYMPYLVGAIAIGGLALVAIAVVRGKRGG